MAQRMLQIQPTIRRHVSACKKADTMLRQKAFPLLFSRVVAQHNTVGADSRVPTM